MWCMIRKSESTQCSCGTWALCDFFAVVCKYISNEKCNISLPWTGRNQLYCAQPNIAIVISVLPSSVFILCHCDTGILMIAILPVSQSSQAFLDKVYGKRNVSHKFGQTFVFSTRIDKNRHPNKTRGQYDGLLHQSGCVSGIEYLLIPLGKVTCSREAWTSALVKTQDCKTLKILSVKAEEFEMSYFWRAKVPSYTWGFIFLSQ